MEEVYKRMKKLCECGCGKRVKKRFAQGHNSGGSTPDKDILEFRKECEELHNLLREKKGKNEAIKRLRKDNQRKGLE